ncbi:hypothetical protein GCM10009828_069470 [Actinoplanes couchii]|uniref:Transposase (putative) YhgA-like domain-containing protein n=1 Tax=Actinoplanes couchii TaxID=403638 RepID=A0ABQ3X5M4_9ACTN|nr:hypothetical protein Aco03nite_022170 [Actinoplanes couchii]
MELFRDRPALAAELLEGPLPGDMPQFDEAHLFSAELNALTPTERRADAVITLTREGNLVMAVVVEVQRRADADKHRSWPAYVATLRDRLRCHVALLVICTSRRVAEWAREPIYLGPPGSVITPVAIGPAQIPNITDPREAREHPELAVLSAITHADDPGIDLLFKAYLAALDVLEPDRSLLYHDYVLSALSPLPRKLLEELMMTAEYQYKSDWARNLVAEGKAEGKVENQAESVLTVLDAKGVAVSAKARSVITNCTDLAQLNEWLRRAVTAERIEDLGGALGG